MDIAAEAGCKIEYKINILKPTWEAGYLCLTGLQLPRLSCFYMQQSTAVALQI